MKLLGIVLTVAALAAFTIPATAQTKKAACVSCQAKCSQCAGQGVGGGEACKSRCAANGNPRVQASSACGQTYITEGCGR